MPTQSTAVGRSDDLMVLPTDGLVLVTITTAPFAGPAFHHSERTEINPGFATVDLMAGASGQGDGRANQTV
jgi:hypothetical protein